MKQSPLQTPPRFGTSSQTKSFYSKRDKSEDTYVLKILADKGLLPNYAFPDKGVTLQYDLFLETDLTPVNLEESFENMIRECYPETTKVGWMDFDTVTIMKENDPIA